MAEKIAIFGGTFDPVHMGHMKMAEYALSCVDRVCFLPNGTPPHKKRGTVATAEQRLEMVRLAIAGREQFFCSDYELTRQGPNYTVETLSHVRSLWGEKPCFMLGADSLRDITGWYRAQDLRDLCELLAFDRTADGTSVTERAEELKRDGWQVTVVKMPRIDVDSTSIRARIKAGETVAGQVPDAVYDYIIRHNLYI